MSTLSSRLIQLRKEKGVTQKALADFLGIAPVSWQRFEYGSSRPKIENIIALAEFQSIICLAVLTTPRSTDNPS